MIAAVSLIVVVLIGVIAGRIGALALMATGVPAEVAKFQARSVLTGVGFTTTESDTLMQHPVRRRILLTLMLVGNAGLVTLAGSIMLSFASAGGAGDIFGRMGVILGGVAIVLWLLRRRRVEAIVTSALTKGLNRFSDLELRDYHHLMRLSADYSVTELLVQDGDWLADRTLIDLDLPHEGVLVLAILRADGEFAGAPRGDAFISAGDTVYLYGRASVLDDLDHRTSGEAGDQAHAEAIAEQRSIDRATRKRFRGRMKPRRRRDRS